MLAWNIYHTHHALTSLGQWVRPSNLVHGRERSFKPFYVSPAHVTIIAKKEFTRNFRIYGLDTTRMKHASCFSNC